MTEPDPDRRLTAEEQFQADLDRAGERERARDRTRRAELEARFGKPEGISPSDALALAVAACVPVDPRVTADDVFASIYRDDAAADAWGQSNRVFHGHPTLAKVPLPDGRVVGILDLRPALDRMREES
jgi:hypothetical protein